MIAWKPSVMIGAATSLLIIAVAVSDDHAAQSVDGPAGCVVQRDVPYYQVKPDSEVPADADRYIPPRPPMQDPCEVRLLR